MSLIGYIVKSFFSLLSSSSIKNETRLFSEKFYPGALENDIKVQYKTGVKGIVTFLEGISNNNNNNNNFNGRIDGIISFNNSSEIVYSCSEKRIEIGSEVEIDITRGSPTSSWFAKRVNVLSCPEIKYRDEHDFDNISQPVDKLPNKQIGMITSACNDTLVLNNTIEFHRKDCGRNSFPAVVGDWVVVLFDKSNTNKVVEVKPLRYIDYEGRISSFTGSDGYIDKEIYFNKSISKGERLTRGIQVYGTAIESVQGRRCNFRALTIFIKNKNQNNNNNQGGLQMRLKSFNNNTENGIRKPFNLGLHLSTKNLDFGEQSCNEIISKEVILTNNNEFTIMLTGIMLSSETNNQFIIENSNSNNDKEKNNLEELLSKKSKKIIIKCVPQFPGLDTQKLFIEGLDSSNESWKIMLDISVYAYDPILKFISMQNESRTLIDKKNASLDSGSNLVGGIHLSAAAPVKLRSILTKVYPHKLKLYPVPTDVETRVENKEDIMGFYSVLKQKLHPGNYNKKMDLLVHLEEINTKEEMKQFVLENVRLIRRRETFGIEVPGLSEGRPSLIVGDKVNVKVNRETAIVFSGTIEDILCDLIFVKFHETLHSNYTNEECTVTFGHSRLPFRRMHLGIEVGCGILGDGILFPEKIEMKPSQCVRLSRTGCNEISAMNFVKSEAYNMLQLRFYNGALNELQRVAVLRILHGYSRPLPYILFGPPGTGKTVTLVEAILQVYKNIPSSRILLCAPSNSAADLLCLRLDESGIIESGEMVRMNAFRRTILSEMSDKEPIPPRVLPYCKSIDDLSEIAMHRIIVCTCISSGALYRLGLKSGHITHVFVDEAGQASEPEIMVSLGLISPFKGQIILAGDPMQLGPVIRSPHAQQLQESYLHRLLLSCTLYQKQAEICPGSLTYFNPLVVTQLLNNYRAHFSLLKLPSDMFYGGTLIPCADKTRFINWKWLPNPEMPFIFHGVRGKELRNQKNPSTYNPSEAVMVVRWIGRLLQDTQGMDQLKDSNISVITPYRAQVDCIRKLISSCLEGVNLAKLKVASVEEFQGQENEVIIISTVRSSLDESMTNGVHESFAIVNTVSSRLGFLSNKRRFNVSITRACSLLIVIGDPSLLQYDECWNSLINYSKINNAYIGTDL